MRGLRKREAAVAFERVKGQPIAVRMLEHELAGDRLPQTFLFYGPEGSGKFLTALELVKRVNCDRGSASDRGCNCFSCRTAQHLTSRDILFIVKTNLAPVFEFWQTSERIDQHVSAFVFDVRRLLLSLAGEGRFGREYELLQEFVRNPGAAEKEIQGVLDAATSVSRALQGSIIGIDSIREAQRFLSLKSGTGTYRCVIIDDAEHLNVEASNCFLKVSEDTPPGAIIILIATEKEHIRETIRSRCRAYRFLPLSGELQAEILRERYGIDTGGESEAPLTFFQSLTAAHGNPAAIDRLVREIIEEGNALSMLDHTLASLGDALQHMHDRDLQDVQEIESLMKQVHQVRISIVKVHADAQTALTDFLLKGTRFLLRYVS
jgi:DNA polymerase III delta prime subunit